MPDAPDDRLLTEAELELMTALWDLGGGTVRDVMAALPEGREPAYTTVSTFLRILVDKGFAAATPRGRTHVYTPLVAREQYEGRSLRHLVGRLFGGDPVALVRRLVSTEGVSEADLERLAALVDERLDDQ